MTNAARRLRIRRKQDDARRIGQQRAELPPPPSRRIDWQMEFVRWCLIAIPFVLIPIGLILLNRARNEWNLGHESNAWPTVPGVVLSTGIIDRSRRTFSFDPQVTYSYEVDGRSYIGDVLRVGGYDYNSRSKVNARLAEYPMGSTVSVRYDPNDPSRSVLEPGVGPNWKDAMLWGLGLGFGGLFLLTWYIRLYWEGRQFARTMRTP